MLAVVAHCPRALGRRQILPRAAGWPLKGPDLALCFSLLEQQLLFCVPSWGHLIIPEQMSAACWGRAGRPAWAAEEKLGHGTPVGNETRNLLWRCTCAGMVTRLPPQENRASNPARSALCMQHSTCSARSWEQLEECWGSSRSWCLPGCCYPTNEGQALAGGWLGGSAPGHPAGIFLRHSTHFFSTMPKQILADY